MVINEERKENELQALPRANVKVIQEIIPIVLDLCLWMRRCEIDFGNTKTSRIKNKCEILNKKIEKLREQTNGKTGRGWLHFEHPPHEGPSLSLMKTWVATSETIITQQRKKQQ